MWYSKRVHNKHIRKFVKNVNICNEILELKKAYLKMLKCMK